MDRPVFTEIKKLRTFVAIAEERSFTKAAARLNAAQPWVSDQLKQLEEWVGLELIIRSKGKPIQITPAGEEMLRIANRLLLSCADAAEDIAESRTIVEFPGHEVSLPFILEFGKESRISFDGALRDGYFGVYRKGLGPQGQEQLLLKNSAPVTLTDWSQDGSDPQQRMRLVRRLIRDRLVPGGRVLLLSVTPHQGSEERFKNLLRLLDEGGR